MPSVRVKLAHFHDLHFAGQRSPPISHLTLGFASTNIPHELQNVVSQDDELGYYEDGVKRTLTDEQIAILRHTEIQELLKDRKRNAGPAVETMRPENDRDQTQRQEVSSSGISQWQESELNLIDANVGDTVREDAQTSYARPIHAEQKPLHLCHDYALLKDQGDVSIAVSSANSASTVRRSSRPRRVVMCKDAFESPHSSPSFAMASTAMPANFHRPEPSCKG